MKLKLTAPEKRWVLYDVANSAFTLLVSTIMPIYFNYLAEQAGLSQVDYLAYWGYAVSAVTLIVALLGPVLGTISDRRGRKKPLFMAALLLGALGCTLLGFMRSWIWFLGVFVLAKAAYSLSLVFYDAMLCDITTPERMDEVSSCGYAWGYIGSCLPFLACLALVLFYGQLGISMSTAMALAFSMVALWWVGCSLPLLRIYRQKYFVPAEGKPFRDSFRRLGQMLRSLPARKDIFFFLLAFFFYIDGVYTIIDMATAYGTALGLDSTGLLLALLVTQIVAFPSSLAFGRLSRKLKAEYIIGICILAYFGIAVFAFWLDNLVKFWILAALVGLFQGTIQAFSRSYYTRIIPPEQSGEYFGLYDICGKGAAFVGTTLVAAVSQLADSTNAGVGSLSVMFLLGLLCFRAAVKARKRYLGEQEPQED